MKKALVFIHGYLGDAMQFKAIENSLGECGADIIYHTVDGHGGSMDKFLKSNADTWSQGLSEHLEELRREYDEIFLVGHSMGGLLATLTAIDNPDNIFGITAIAYPIKIFVTRDWLSIYYRAAFPPKQGEDLRVTAARSMSGVKIRNPRELLRAVPKSRENAKLAKQARKRIGDLSVPLTVINFANDETVSKKAAQFVRDNLPSANVVVLEKSYHFLFDKNEVEKMAQYIREMISR